MFNALIISYLFLGGMGSGSFLVLACAWALSSRMALAANEANPLLRPGYRRFLAVGFGVSLAVQLLGILCLLVDLERPKALLYMILTPQPSAVTVGAYALAILVACTLVLALSRLGIVRVPRLAEGIVALLGAIDSCVVMVYTALLLQSLPGAPFWHSPFIPALFVTSSVSTGIACVVMTSVLARGHSTVKGFVGKLMSLDFVLVVVELALLIAFVTLGLASDDYPAAFAALLFGSLSKAFWLGLVGLGLAAPALLNACARRFCLAYVNPLVVSLLVMVGGVALRYCIVGAGVL